MKVYSLKKHFLELKTRILRILLVFITIFIICYYFSEDIYNISLYPLLKLSDNGTRRIIYTGLTEAFFTYVKLAAFSSFVITLPVISLEIYFFISPGLYKHEKKIAACILFLSTILFWFGVVFVYYYVIPTAWRYFLSFEYRKIDAIPIILEARISEYLNLVIRLIVAFGMAFQIPIFMLILSLMKVIKASDLKKNRRLAIVINFIIAGILAPPDIISQFILAIPMLLLYEISIILCKYLENRKKEC